MTKKTKPNSLSCSAAVLGKGKESVTLPPVPWEKKAEGK